MAGWVERSLDARDVQRRELRRKKEEDASHLAMQVSRLLGEVVEPQAGQYDAEPFVEVQEDGLQFRFVFATEDKKGIALKWKCETCLELYLTPVSRLAEVGEIIHGAQDRRNPCLPPHKGCSGKRIG